MRHGPSSLLPSHAVHGPPTRRPWPPPNPRVPIRASGHPATPTARVQTPGNTTRPAPRSLEWLSLSVSRSVSQSQAARRTFQHEHQLAKLPARRDPANGASLTIRSIAVRGGLVGASDRGLEAGSHLMPQRGLLANGWIVFRNGSFSSRHNNWGGRARQRVLRVLERPPFFHGTGEPVNVDGGCHSLTQSTLGSCI